MDQQPQASGRLDSTNPAEGISASPGASSAATDGITTGPGLDAPPPAPPLTPMGWLSQNGPFLAVMLALLVLVYVKLGGLDGILKVGLVIVGLGFVIFIHELGHFVAAKWCDVHVTTFSIGFGPALPGCNWQRGETTYKIAVLPLGGYVQMVGEGAENDEGEEDPRSFKNKSVGQRMIIISAGVIMNVILGAICFITVYRFHGVPQMAAAVERIDPGSPAWEKGVHSNSRIIKMGDITNPSFNELKMMVALTGGKEKPIPFTFVYLENGKEVTVTIDLSPRRGENNKMPAIGVVPPEGLKLVKKSPIALYEQPYYSHSAAAAARVIDLNPGDKVISATNPENEDGTLTPLADGPDGTIPALCHRMRKLVGKPMKISVLRKGATEAKEISLAVGGFDFEDAVYGTTDPKTPNEPFNVTPLDEAPPQLVGHTANEDRDPFDFHRRMKRLAARPVVLQVKRGGVAEPINILVPPAYHWTLPLQMQMGKVVAVRDESTAKDKILPGDIISGVRLVYDAEPAIDIDVLDPIRLPFLLAHTIEKANKPDPAKWKVELKVKRPPSDPSVKKDALVEVLFTLDWQDQWSSNDEVPAAPSSPMSIPQLGIAYLVESLVLKVTDPALTEIQKGDVIEKISVREPTEKGSEEKWTNWVKIQSKRDGEKVSDQWAYFALYYLQLQEYPEVKVQLQRDNKTVRLQLTEDASWPLANRGLHFRSVMKLVKADSLSDSLAYGYKDTVSSIKSIYLTLRSLLNRDVSPELLGGPIEIASQTFAAADDPWILILYLGMISVNLAVVNFLPIPVLDGGHMVFLIYEKLRGKPASETVRAAATYLGLAIILGLMVFVFYNDISKRWSNRP